jgi:uncharacterized protein with GYD domain
MGGRLESMYFAFGESDFFITVELPDTTAAMALSVGVNASGSASARTTVLVTPEELDAATKKPFEYRRPGS